MDIVDLPLPTKFKYKWRSPFDFNNTFAVPHIYAIVYNGKIKYIGKSSGTRPNYYTGGVIPNKIKHKGIKGVLEFTTINNLDKREQYWIDKVNPSFNISAGGRGGLIGNRNPSKRKSVRSKISKKLKGRKLSEEHKLKLKIAKLKNPVKAHLGKKRSDETKRAIKETHKKRNTEKYNMIKRMLKEGYYTKEICKTLKTSSATVSKIKSELGLKHKHSRSRLEFSPQNKY